MPGTLIWAIALLGLITFGNKSLAKITFKETETGKNHPKLTPKEIFAKNHTTEKNITLKNDHINGRVKSYRKETFIVNYETGEKQLNQITVEKFDARGNSTEFLYTTANGEFVQMTRIFYDANGNDTSAWACDSTGAPVWKRLSRRYDRKGNELESNFFAANGKQIGRETSQYDDKGNVLEFNYQRSGFEVSGSIVSIPKKPVILKWTYTYDQNNFETGGLKYDDSGRPDGKMTSKNDADGNQLESVIYNLNNSILFRGTRKYDAHGNCIEHIEYEGENKIITKETMKYDDYDNKTELITSNPDGSIDREHTVYKEYVYDATGNIIKETDFEDDDGKKVPMMYFETEYTYY